MKAIKGINTIKLKFRGFNFEILDALGFVPWTKVEILVHLCLIGLIEDISAKNAVLFWYW